MFNHIQAVAFDMDGLIFDTEKLYQAACLQTAEEFGIEFEENFYLSMVGQSTAFGRELFTTRYGQDFPIDDYQKRWSQVRIDMVNRGEARFKPGFEDLFAHLNKINIPASLVTASAIDDVHINFAGYPQLGQFHSIITSNDPYPAKPAPDKYLAAAERMQVEPKNMLVLEDSNTGMMAALNARATAVMVPDLISPKDDIRARAYAVFASLNEVKIAFDSSSIQA